MNNIRVLHCPTMVAGNPQGLARAERQLGLESWSVAFEGTFIDYQADEVIIEEKGNRAVLEIMRWKILWRALKRYDIIHFNFGQSIMPPLPSKVILRKSEYPKWLNYFYYLYARMLNMFDVDLLRRAGKGIVVTFMGDDARQGDYSLAKFEISIAREVGSTYYAPETDRVKRELISRFSRNADRIFYLNPDLAHVLPPQAEFLPYGHIDLGKWRPSSATRLVSHRPTLSHAPTNRDAKGTRYVLQAVSRLREEGIPFDFLLIEGMPHCEVRDIYKRVDLFVDQLLAGWYGAVAVELMALGKPVISYIRESDLKFIPQEMRKDLPIINATPATIYSALKEWLTVRRDELPEVGQLSRAYVEKWHDPVKIAARLKSEYEAILGNPKSRREGSKTQGSLK